MPAPAIRVEALRVVRGEAVALDGVSFDVLAGRVTGLLGPSGSGKSTLIRSLVGVQRLVSGRVTVLGEAAGSAALRSRVGCGTQAPSVYGDLSVRENLPASSAACPGVSGLASRSRARSSTTPRCSCWTSRRSGSTRCCGATSGAPSTSFRSAARCSSRAM